MAEEPTLSKVYQCRQNINQLFTNLSTKLTNRKQVLLVELDGIEKRHAASITAEVNSKVLETLRNELQAMLDSMENMEELVPVVTRQAVRKAIRQIDSDSKKWRDTIRQKFSNIIFEYRTTDPIHSINQLGAINKNNNINNNNNNNNNNNTILLIDSADDNFLTRLKQCRQQIDQLFSGLNTKLADRKQVLSVELDGIEKSYAAAKYNSQKLETMINKQEEMLASMESVNDLITTETKQPLIAAISQLELNCNKWKAKIDEFSNISLKYDTTGPLNSIHQLGAITVNSGHMMSDVEGTVAYNKKVTHTPTPPYRLEAIESMTGNIANANIPLVTRKVSGLVDEEAVHHETIFTNLAQMERVQTPL